jgi:thiosulfate/3-mercaptopyruvate sulfurtransferase
MQPIISVDELRARLERSELRLVDARYSLADPGAGREAYRDSHLPGAVYLHLDEDLSGPPGEHGGRHPLPEPQALAATFGRAGIGPDTHVVAYDDGDGMIAGRVWWMLRWLGHDSVQVLDGGLSAWRAAGGPETAEVPRLPRAVFEPAPRAEMLVDRRWLLEHLADPQLTVIDARAPERYRGESEPLDPRAGHLPGAVNLPFAGNLEGGRFKDEEALRARFADVAEAATLVVYCGSGVSAAHDVLALELAGVRGARLYPGSWSDWVSYDDAPVATGPRGGGPKDGGESA